MLSSILGRFQVIGEPAADTSRALRRDSRWRNVAFFAAKNAAGRFNGNQFVFVVVHNKNLASSWLAIAARSGTTVRCVKLD